MVLRCSADIAIYGGAAGGGKTWGLLADDVKHIGNPRYRSLTFRRTYPQIRNPGGLWDESYELFPHVGGAPNQSTLEWRFPSGAVTKFAHMQYEDDKLQYQGAQIPVIKWDELTHFSESMFWYMLSRNRSVSGIRPYIRATCNADAESWVAKLIQWWWDENTGLPFPERAGVVRWFTREGGEIRWANKASELKPWPTVEIDGEMVPQPPKTFTFIPAKVTDNKILLSKNPSYLSDLLALPPVERGQLLEGNWKIKPAAGEYFKRHWFPIVPTAPADAVRVRKWDFAGTKPSDIKKNDPDWTVGVKVSRTADNRIFIEDIVRLRGTPGEVQALLKQTAVMDGPAVTQHLEQEPGSAGIFAVNQLVTETLLGLPAFAERATGNKLERMKPLSSQAQVGNVSLVKGEWNEAFLMEAEQIPTGSHDDMIDAAAGGFAVLADGGLTRWEREAMLETVAPEGVTPATQEMTRWEKMAADLEEKTSRL